MGKFKINIEIVLAISTFSGHLAGLLHSNYIIYRTCYSNMGYNESDCAMLGNTDNNITKHLEPIVEEKVTVVHTVRSTVESIIPIMLCFCVGPWSDKFGRKPIIVAAYIGSVISSGLMLLTTFFSQLSVWYITFYNLPALFLGGGIATTTIMLSYVVDSTPEEYRGFRFALIDIIYDITNVLGKSSSSYIFNSVGYTGAFIIIFVCSIACALYAIFLLPESLKDAKKGKIIQLIDISNFKEIVTIPFKKREKYLREIVLLLLAFTAVGALSKGEHSVTYLFLRKKFGWTLKKYSWYGSFRSALSAIGVSSSIFVFQKLLSVPETPIIVCGLFSYLCGCLLEGFATNDIFIYSAGVAHCLGGLVGPMQKSFIAKLFSKHEIGKLFSLMLILTFVVGLGSTPLFNLLYKSTLHTHPGAFNFLAAAFQFICILIYTIIMVYETLLKKTKKKLDEEKPSNQIVKI